MKNQKLNLNDFVAVDTAELLEVKGGRGRHWRTKQPPGFFQEGDGSGGGGGGITGYPQCDQAGETTRCNGARHSPDFWATMEAGWKGLMSLGGLAGAGTGAAMTGGAYSIPFGSMTGASNHVQNSLNAYHSGMNTAGSSNSNTSAPSRAGILTGCN